MKLVFSSPDSATLGLMKSQLEVAGIACVLRNEFVAQAIPGTYFAAELWVIDDDSFEEAAALIKAWQMPDEAADRSDTNQ